MKRCKKNIQIQSLTINGGTHYSKKYRTHKIYLNFNLVSFSNPNPKPKVRKCFSISVKGEHIDFLFDLQK